MEEWETLTVEEKRRALRMLVKDIEMSKFTIEQQAGAENIIMEPNEVVLENYQNLLKSMEDKRAFYMSKLAELDD
jgi:hypothetical protein